MKAVLPFETKVSVAFAAAVLVVLTLTATTWQMANTALEAMHGLAHAQEVLESLDRARADTLAIELHTQGYRISGEAARLTERDAAIEARETTLRRIQQLTADHPPQQERWVRLRAVVDERLAIARRTEQLRATQGLAAASAYVTSVPVRETRDRLFHLLGEMETEERRMLAEHNATQQQARQHRGMVGTLAGLTLLALLAATYGLIRHQLRATEADRQARVKSEEKLSITLQAIADAVLATDAQGRITRMNPVAQRLSGWSLAQARGRPVDEVLRLVHEQTRAPVELPVARVLATGLAQEHGMPQHSLLLARDGREWPVADSAAPIRDASGQLLGVVLVFRDVSAERQAARTIARQNQELEQRVLEKTAQLRESEARFRGLVESSSDWIWEVDAQGRYVYASPKVKELLGYDPDEIIGKTPFDFMPAPEATRVASVFANLAAQRRPFHALENQNRHKDGHTVVLETSGVPVLDSAGTLLGYRGVDRDISERRRAEETIRESTQRLTLHFQQTPLAVIDWDTDFRVLDWNPAAEKIFGYSREQALGQHALALIVPQGAQAHVAQIWERLLAGQADAHGSNENRTRDGQIIYCDWYNTPLLNAQGQVVAVTSLALDVTQQKQDAERIAYQAYYDELTGLPNRTLFKDRLAQAFIEADRKERLVGVAFLDIDNFKDVNDTLGHEAGDALLKMVARRLQDCLRPSDTVARFGGDEFALILADVGHADDVAQVMQHMRDSFREPFAMLDHELRVTCSVGLTLYPLDDNTVERLLRNADSALYAAKAAGRNCDRFYNASMTARARDHLILQAGLRRALAQGEFLLHYQPQLEISSRRIVGMEALVRWQHPQQGLIAPDGFIPVAEESDLIVELGEWVLRTACQQARSWQAQGLPPLRMAVNLSARQFRQKQFAQQVLDILDESGLAPRYLELEVTESILINDHRLEAVRAALQAFKQAGILISLDDFGTGYSSLSYLKRFPIDKLKIDQSFIRDALVNANDASLVKTIIAMAQALGIRSIAEGVETQEQLAFLRAERCDEIQGYHIACPLPAEQVPDLLRQYNTT